MFSFYDTIEILLFNLLDFSFLLYLNETLILTSSLWNTPKVIASIKKGDDYKWSEVFDGFLLYLVLLGKQQHSRSRLATSERPHIWGDTTFSRGGKEKSLSISEFLSIFLPALL